MTSPVLDRFAKTSYVLLYDASWEQLEQLEINLAGTGARLSYLDSILEMSPLSDEHEDSKKP